MYGKTPEALWTSIRITAGVRSGGDSSPCWEAAVYSAYSSTVAMLRQKKREI